MICNFKKERFLRLEEFKHKYPDSNLLKHYGELFWTKDTHFIQDKILSFYNKLIFCIKK